MSTCVFCGKEIMKERFFLEGAKGKYICHKCIGWVSLAADAQEEYERDTYLPYESTRKYDGQSVIGKFEVDKEVELLDAKEWKTPQDIFHFLNQSVIGQTEAKKALSVAVEELSKGLVKILAED